MLSFPLLGRSRSWAAPAWLSLLSLLTLSLLCAAPIQAQQYPGGGYPGGGADSYSVVYSGGSTTVTTTTPPNPTQTTTTPYRPNASTSAPGAWGGGAFTYIQGGGGSGSVTCAGQITATFTWNGGPNNDPPPTSAIVTETANVAWGGPGSSGDCGLPNPTTPASQPPNQTATRYTVNSGGSSFSVNCTPTASMSGTSPQPYQVLGGSAYVGYTASASPVAIKLTGPTPDSSGNLNILVGQHCSASLPGLVIPSGATVSYQWSVSGTTFQYWSADTPANGNNPYNPDASYEVNGPGPLTNPTAGWYWNDSKQTSETVSCTATVTPPAGQGSAFTVTVTQKVTVMVPGWTFKGIGGTMQVNNTYPPYPGSTDYWLWAGPTAGTSEVAGMEWDATVSPPVGTTFGAGSLELVQLFIPNRSYTTTGLFGSTSTHPWSINGQEGLDTNYPYSWDVGAPSYEANDSPGFNLTAVNAHSAQLGDQFEDYLMYFAPGSNQCVPLARFVWSINGNATIPDTGNWANFGAGSAGTVTPSGTTNIGRSNAFPMWTQIFTATSGHW